MPNFRSPPQPVTWALDPPITFGSATYDTITLRGPTTGDILKATAVQGEGGYTVGLRLIANISTEGIPYEALLRIPAWQYEQMSAYFDSFAGAPMPSPLAEWAVPDEA